jgi:hypothetical protein
MPLGPPQQYVVKYNGQQLPGYAQMEDDPSDMNIADHYAFGWDGSLSQYVGLNNKNFHLDFLVWEKDYRAVKDAYHLATTILRSRREGFAPLFVDYTDRYLNATVKTVTYQQDVQQSRRILKYSVDFNTEPYWISTSGYTITGAGNVDTDQVDRTFNDGGWTPTWIEVTGTNITISGYTDTEFTGFVSISGHVVNYVVDTENFTTVTASGSNGDKFMYWKDYQMWVGPGKTTFAVSGATDISISYHNRWY